MKIIKPNFWRINKSFFSYLFFPLTIIYNLIIYLKRKYTKKIKFNLPIVCIGNIYVGGTGKTPLSIFLACKLSEKQKKPSIIRKLYKDHNDEYQLIRKYFKNLFINKNRVNAIYEAENKGFDLAILDDGFQDYKIEKNLSIICFNQNQQIGNGLIFPAGPLRENLSILKSVQIVVINGKKDKSFEEKIKNFNNNIDIYYSEYQPINLNSFRNKKLLVVSGIGNPENFFNLLIENNLKVEKSVFFPDHYEFSRSEIDNLVKEAYEKNLQIIMTEKDYLRVKDFNFKEIDYLKIELLIKNESNFINRVLKVYDKNF